MAEPEDPHRTVLLPGNGTFAAKATDASSIGDTGRIPAGTVLNHIYRVDRLIARGGMGEVYEGTNISDVEERVAIKVVLPHLAADPNVQTLFRAEARTLTRFAHPGLVQYRLIALEPQLDILYIVTEFVDGPALSDVLGTISVSADALAQFIRRLASALAAAHALGRIHRDLSPDNILLPHGALDEAKIIDFGIAKDLAAAQGKTIVGTGFAGKLGYVAPEQFGETRDVGPWTDVYSLGLVALALALGRAPPMGLNFADAVEKRRRVPDLSAVPPLLAPVLTRMLQPERTERYQTMNEVVAAIDAIPRAELPETASAPAAPTPPVERARPPARRAFLSPGAVIAAAVCTFAVGAAVWIGTAIQTPPSPRRAVPVLQHGRQVAAHPPPIAPATPQKQKLQAAVDAALPGIGCSWLDVERLVPKVALSGVAADSFAAASAVSAALAGRKLNASVDTSHVFAVKRSACDVLDAFRAFRAAGGDTAIKPLQPVFHLQARPQNCPVRTVSQADVAVTFHLPGPAEDFALLGITDSGQVQTVAPSRNAFLRIMANRMHRAFGPDRRKFRFSLCADVRIVRQSPVLGYVLVSGHGPFAPALPGGSAEATPAGSAAWLKRFEASARAGAWTTQMGWVRVDAD